MEPLDLRNYPSSARSASSDGSVSSLDARHLRESEETGNEPDGTSSGSGAVSAGTGTQIEMDRDNGSELQDSRVKTRPSTRCVTPAEVRIGGIAPLVPYEDDDRSSEVVGRTSGGMGTPVSSTEMRTSRKQEHESADGSMPLDSSEEKAGVSYRPIGAHPSFNLSLPNRRMAPSDLRECASSPGAPPNGANLPGAREADVEDDGGDVRNCGVPDPAPEFAGISPSSGLVGRIHMWREAMCGAGEMNNPGDPWGSPVSSDTEEQRSVQDTPGVAEDAENRPLEHIVPGSADCVHSFRDLNTSMPHGGSRKKRSQPERAVSAGPTMGTTLWQKEEDGVGILTVTKEVLQKRMSLKDITRQQV